MRDPQEGRDVARDRLSDADRLMDCLCGSRERATMYAMAALESANNGVREFFLAMHGEETHQQEILFHFLHTRGFYPTRTASEEQIREVWAQYRQIHDQIGLTPDPSFRRYHTADPQAHPAMTQNEEHFERH